MRHRLARHLRLPARRWIAWLAGGTTIAAALTIGWTLWPVRDDERKPTAAGTTVVRRDTVTTTVSAAGAAKPLASRPLNFSIAGTVTELDVKPGDVVSAGAVLARIDSAAAASAVEQAKTRVANAEEAVTKAQATVATAVAAAYHPLVESTTGATSPTPGGGPGSIPAKPSASPSTPQQPTPGPTRSSSPGDQGSPPTGGAPTSGGTGRQGGAAGGGSSADSLLSAEQQLNEARLALKQATTALAGVVITAPVAGKILSVGGAVGGTATVSANGFMVLAGTNDVAVQAEFTEAEIAGLALGQPAKITLPDRQGEEFSGAVLEISPQGNISDKLVRYPAVISFDKIPDNLLYGQTANVAVITASAEGVLCVPATAVGNRKGTTGAVTVKVGNRTARRTVQLGLRGDVLTEIRSGLAEGDEILTAFR